MIGGNTIADGFASRLRQRTNSAHRHAEMSPFMRALFTGKLTKAGYVTYAAQLLVVYRELDAASEVMADDPIGGCFADSALLRARALESDIHALSGADEIPAPLPATLQYRDRVRAVAFDWPGGFVAHHYTRHLGDLSGGLHIARALRRHLIDGDDAGLSFYELTVPDPDAYKARYRALLDAAPWDDDERERIVDEVLEAYRLNHAVLLEVSEACGVQP